MIYGAKERSLNRAKRLRPADIRGHRQANISRAATPAHNLSTRLPSPQSAL